MKRITALVVAGVLLAGLAGALPAKNEPVAPFSATALDGAPVDLKKIAEGKPNLVILFFFTPDTGDRVAFKLRRLDLMYGRDKVKIIGVGCRQQAEAIKAYAAAAGLTFPVVVDAPGVDLESRLGPFQALPVTIALTGGMTVHSVLCGGADAEAKIISHIAESFLQQHCPAEAQKLADEAVTAGEPPEAAGAVKGYALAAEGKLDAAREEFGKIDFKEGLAKIALEKGDLDAAAQLADEAATGYAGVIKGQAQLLSGQLDAAAQTLQSAASKPASDWQRAEGLNLEGRVVQELGNTDGALSKFEQAIAMDPYNVVALSNEGAALRDKGELAKAADTLEKAQAVRPDEVSALMLKQIRAEMQEANDIKRGEAVREQVKQLQQRYAEMKAAAKDKPADDWTSPPLVVALLPGAQVQAAALPRAGVDLALRREIAARLQNGGAVKVVEREVLDQLLQELNIGSSELASADTQLQLGKVLSARLLGFVDVAPVGAEAALFVRLVDTETTAIAAHFQKTLPGMTGLDAVVEELAAEIEAKLVDARPLQGLVADAPGDGSVIINIGANWGIKPGMRFNVLSQGPPIEAGGKVIGHRQAAVGVIEAVEVEPGMAVCKTVAAKEGAVFSKEMRVRQAQP